LYGKPFKSFKDVPTQNSSFFFAIEKLYTFLDTISSILDILGIGGLIDELGIIGIHLG
jgi:hypothetical protein